MKKTSTKKYTISVQGFFPGWGWIPMRELQGDYEWDTIERAKLALKRMVKTSKANAWAILQQDEIIFWGYPHDAAKLKTSFKKYFA